MIPGEDIAARSGILKAEFGERWRWWAWFRRQWSTTSLVTVVTGVGILGGWAVNLKTRVVVLETRVVPVIKDEGRVDSLAATVTGHEQRLTRLERNWDDAKNEAGTPPVVIQKPRRGAQ